MIEDLLARFIVGGIAVLQAAELLGVRDYGPARIFFLSPAWLVLRYTLFTATVVLCLVLIGQGT